MVESAHIKKALEAVYIGILPKGTSPFIYLRYALIHAEVDSCLVLSSMELDPGSVDVNVHPTKREVNFLNEEAIIERIADKVQESLVTQSSSRTFDYQVTGFLRIHKAWYSRHNRRCLRVLRGPHAMEREREKKKKSPKTT